MAPDRSTAIDSAYGTVVFAADGPRREHVLDMVRGLSTAGTPHDVLTTFSEGIRRIRPMSAYVSVSVRDLPAGHYKITRFIDTFDAEAWRRSDPWKNWDQLPARRDGLIGQLIAAGQPVVIRDLNVPDDPALGDRLAGFGSLMAIPLYEAGRPLNWSINLHHEPHAFSADARYETLLQGNLVGGTVRHVMIAQQLRAATERINHEVDEIARIQRSLLPSATPEIAGLSIRTHYETFDRAGGDLFDFLSLSGERPAPPDGPWAMLVGDVSGHGPSAAVVMAMVHTLVQSYAGIPNTPGDLLQWINRHLCRLGIEPAFVTAFMAFYDPPTRRLAFSRAGHPPPLLKLSPEPGRDVRHLGEAGGVPLGIFDEAEFPVAELTLEPGQSLVLYTDGVTEAQGPGRPMFGLEGVEDAVSDCVGDPACIIASITDALAEHQANVRPEDDQTIVAMQVV